MNNIGRFFTGFFTSILIVGVLGAFVGAQSLNDFTIESFHTDYTLSRDSDDHSRLLVEETIVAYFPHKDINRGIERAIPRSYDGHPTSLSIVSVVDENGASIRYASETDGSMEVLRIGDPKTYVSGSKTYVITYAQRDVMKTFTDNNRQEWYWDTNGTEWRVPVKKVSATVILGGEIQPALVGEPRCYAGAFKSTGVCEITKGDDGVFTASAQNLARGETMTLAFGFNQGTFAEYEMPFMTKVLIVWGCVAGLTFFIAAGIQRGLARKYKRMTYRTKEIGFIPAQYIPMQGVSVTLANELVDMKKKGSVLGAQLVDLAVRRYIQIIEVESRGFFSKKKEYEIAILSDTETLLEEEREVLVDIFNKVPVVGDRVSLAPMKTDASYAQRMADNKTKVQRSMRGDYDIKQSNPDASASFTKQGKLLLIPAILTVSPFLLSAAMSAFRYGKILTPLTDKGLDIKRHLLGFEKYIKLAEKDRLAFLQSTETAEKVGQPIDVNNSEQIVKLYERALPYAILFGHEKTWSKAIGDIYETNATMAPDWYQGNGDLLKGAALASMVDSFVKSSNYVSYSQSSSSSYSSSSSGSSGGGFAGGGGGGGGGGGW